MSDFDVDLARVRAAIKVVTAEMDMMKSWGPDAKPCYDGIRGKTLDKAWEYLGMVFAKGIKEAENA